MEVSVPAVDWNADVDRLGKALPIAGRNCRLHPQEGNGVIVSGADSAAWEHPWQVNATYEFRADGKGEWRARIRAGFVNGRDAHIPMPAHWPEKEAPARDVPLTDDPEPYLLLAGWRNPLAPAGISASSAGDLVYAPGEGYPKFFAQLGVKPAAKGGVVGKVGAAEAEPDPLRTRELRAMDIVLAQPRIGSRLDVQTGEPTIDAQTQFLSTVFVNDAVRATGGRARLRAVAKWQAPGEQTLAGLYGIALAAGDPQFDEVRMSTVWIVSPPDTSSEAEPDQTWAVYPEHRVFWNLCHAPRAIPPRAPQPPIRLDVPLAGGVAQPIINGLLAGINDRFAEMDAFFSQGDTRGMFWST